MSTAVAKTDVPRSKTLDQYAKAINAAKGKTNALIFEVAENLLAAQLELASHDKTEGKFCAWVKAECGFGKSTTYKYLAVYKAFDGCCPPGGQHIDPSAMYFLSKDTTPEEALADALKAAKSGEHVNLRRAKEFAEQYTLDAEATATDSDGDDDSEWDDEPADLAKSWSPAACALDVRPVVAKWAKLCPSKETKDLAQILRDLADQVEKGAWSER